MIELFIEKKSVDIDKGISTLISYAVDDIKEFGYKNTNFSKSFVLPGTKQNNQLLGNIFEINRSTQYNPALPNIGYNYNAAVSAKAIIFSENIQVFKGVLRLLEIIIDEKKIEYEVVVFGELGGFISALGNKKLEDLDFSAYNQIYSTSNIVASWAEPVGTGVYFPLIDYGTYSFAKKDWLYRTFRPALHAYEYLQKIFAGTTYTFDAPIFETARFKNLIIPHNQKRLTYLSSTLLNCTFSASGILDPTEDLFANYTFINQGDFIPVGVNGDLQYIGPSSITAKLEIKVDLYHNDQEYIFFEVTKNLTTTLFFLDLPTSNYQYINPTFTFNPNDYIRIVAHYYSGNNTYYEVNFNGSIKFKYDKPTSVPINLGENILINDSLPKNILQKDFFTSIIKLFNLYVYEDKENTNRLKIAPYIDFYNTDASNFLDWTDKLDNSKPIKIKPLSELNARYYHFKYKSDSDFYNETYRKRYNENYGDRIFDSEFEFEADKKEVEIIFSGTPLVGYPSEEKVYSTILKSNNGVEETIDSNIRLLQREIITGVAPWSIKDGNTVLGTYTTYPYAGHLDDPDVPTNDLNFGVPKELFFALLTGAINVNQFNVYYSTYMAEITDADSKLLTANFYLTKIDIANLDFAKLIWLKSSLFRLNKIYDFNATKADTCKAELLKVINTTY